MAEWQEEWAEDEELPQDCAVSGLGSSSSASSSSSAESGLSAALQPLTKERQREAVLAQARLQKVQTAKRKAGKYG